MVLNRASGVFPKTKQNNKEYRFGIINNNRTRTRSFGYRKNVFVVRLDLLFCSIRYVLFVMHLFEKQINVNCSR